MEPPPKFLSLNPAKGPHSIKLVSKVNLLCERLGARAFAPALIAVKGAPGLRAPRIADSALSAHISIFIAMPGVAICPIMPICM